MKMKKSIFKLLNFFKEESKTPREKEVAPIKENTQVTANESFKEKRKYFRVAPLHPVISTLNIAKINGKPVELKHTEVLIEEIGPGGLQFLSELNFPTAHNLVFSFETVILGKELQINGKIQWKKEKEGLHQYGIEFDIDDATRKELTQHLNKFMLSLKNEGMHPTSHFYREDRVRFFETRQRKI